MARSKKKGASKGASDEVTEPAAEETPSAAELDATPAPTVDENGVDESDVTVWDETTPARGTPPASTPPIPAAQAKAELEAERERRDRSRLRRLERVGVTIDRCPVLDIELDVPLDLGLPGARDVLPIVQGDLVISRLAHQVLGTGATPEQLEHTAAWLRGRRG